jgi:hypothetical protein
MLAVLTLAAAWAGGCGEPADPAAGEAAQGAADGAPSPMERRPAAGAAGRPMIGLPDAPPAPGGVPPLLERSPHYIFTHAVMEPVRDESGRPLGVRVVSIKPGGRVALAGVEAGDLIFYIDGIKVDDPAIFPQSVRYVEDVFLRGRPQRIHVERKGKRMALIPLQPVRTEPAAPGSAEKPAPPSE